ncbi:MAG: GNAT family N-acetyltransferase [Acidimicrobiales bacterium]
MEETRVDDPSIEIRRAGITDLEEVARLFDLYRQFYECEADLALARKFIGARMSGSESTIFVASTDGGLVGFVQLYPSFCSVEAVKISILYDLYVDAAVRGRGVGERLMREAANFAKADGSARVDLETAKSNVVGQRLYEKLGYERTLEDFHAYSLQLNR